MSSNSDVTEYSGRRFTFCRLCEQLCGLEVTLRDGQITHIRPDREHPTTKGLACPKGLAAEEMRSDPDRVVHPLRRRGDGKFEPVSWETAISEIGARLRQVIEPHGRRSVGMYVGNPTAFNASHFTVAKGLIDALGTRHFYTSGSQDTNSRFAASYFLYGSPFTVPVPDLPRTDFLLMVGANPVISHGSLLSGGVVRVDLSDIVNRGGRVVVVDPRRTETAERFEHVAVRPDGDAWLLLSLLNVIFTEGLDDRSAARVARGGFTLREFAATFTPEVAAPHSGVSPDVARSLARDLATARSAAVYGRVGACLGRYSTLVNFLLDALNVVTGNIDRPGGSIFPTPPIDFWAVGKKQGLDTYGTTHSRIGGYPEIGGIMPAGVIAQEITTPGEGQLRALIVTAGNPALSVPGGSGLAEALGELDLLVSIDFYVTETGAMADYILPATTFLEREDANIFVMPYQYRTFIQWTDPVVEPRGEARQEARILQDIADEIGIVPSSAPAVRRLGRFARVITPQLMFDALLRLGPAGDRFGLRRGGLSRKKLRSRPHGVLVSETVPTGVLDKMVTRPDGLIDLAPGPVMDEIRRLRAEVDNDTEGRYPFRVFGRRELKSLNSWLHNSPTLNRKGIPPSLLMNPDDADSLGLRPGDQVQVESRAGAVQARLETTETVSEGACVFRTDGVTTAPAAGVGRTRAVARTSTH